MVVGAVRAPLSKSGIVRATFFYTPRLSVLYFVALISDILCALSWKTFN